ncbi:hypothetical protein HAX54_044115, partial [Datura stramonium]|nr:hypothetical protein [Datura stramonium]
LKWETHFWVLEAFSALPQAAATSSATARALSRWDKGASHLALCQPCCASHSL